MTALYASNAVAQKEAIAFAVYLASASSMGCLDFMPASCSKISSL